MALPNKQLVDKWNKERGYVYEHVNGTRHRKPYIVVYMGGGPREYFSGPMVRQWWREGDEPLPPEPPKHPLNIPQIRL